MRSRHPNLEEIRGELLQDNRTRDETVREGPKEDARSQRQDIDRINDRRDHRTEAEHIQSTENHGYLLSKQEISKVHSFSVKISDWKHLDSCIYLRSPMVLLQYFQV